MVEKMFCEIIFCTPNFNIIRSYFAYIDLCKTDILRKTNNIANRLYGNPAGNILDFLQSKTVKPNKTFLFKHIPTP